MKKSLLLFWLALPVFGGIYHLTAGEFHLQMDQAGWHLRAGRSAVQKSEWHRAAREFEKALELVPDDQDQLRRDVRLQLAQAKIHSAGLPDANEDLKKLLAEVTADDVQPADPILQSRVRETLAESQYYLAWLMRLEGVAREEWLPELESARQNYRLLAEQAQAVGDTRGQRQQQENLEASIRLEQMAIDDLQGLPIPKPCQSCCSKCRSRRPGTKPAQKPNDGRGASAGPPADGAGS